ncbi:UNVERIFIED_CONTAM: hypothetical protein RMT77_018969 [Armadillidium vulgare]
MIYLNCVGKSGLFSSKFKLSLSNNIIGVILITVTLVIKLMMASEETDVLAECKEAISKYVRTRATHKAKVTMLINKLKNLESESKLNKFIFDTSYEKINNELLEIKSLDDKILNVMSQLEIDITEPDFFNKEIERSSNYHFDLSVEISNFGKYLEQNKTQVNESVCSNEQFIEMMSKINASHDYKLPVINCDQFDGSQKDKLVFHNFLTKFNNVIGNKESLEDSVKLMYLFGYLKGYALKVVSHLSLNNDNYKVALELLKKEFLDKNLIINEYMNKLNDLKIDEGHDLEFINTKLFINEVRSIIFELKVYDLNFLEPHSAGNILLSNIIFKKLPRIFKSELIHKLENNYPSLEQIFQNYNDVINTLNIVSKTKKEMHTVRPNAKTQFKKSFKSNSFQNFATNVDHVQTSKINDVKDEPCNTRMYNVCKLCQIKNHPLYKCDKYNTVAQRVERAKVLNLCTRCAAIGHNAYTCFGKNNKLRFNCFKCKEHSHITAFCPKIEATETKNDTVNSLCISLQQQADRFYLLPTISIDLIRGNKKVTVRSILETGSQKTYISKDILSHIIPDYDTLNGMELNIQTFIGKEQRQFKQLLLGIKISGMDVFSMKFLVDENLNLNYTVNGVNEVIHEFKHQGIPLADSTFNVEEDNNKFHIQALLGVDILQYFPSLELVSIMSGSCFKVSNKYIPFGNIQNFLPRKQKIALNNEKVISSKTDVDEGMVNETVVNLILNPNKSYFHPFENILMDSEVENGLEYLFSMESVGIPSNNNDDICNYDAEMVSKFKEGISFNDGHYHVTLPWKQELIKRVPSNFDISLKVLNRVYNKLNSQNLVTAYNEVFEQQQKDGIIEEINVPDHKKHEYVFIPHRPVIRYAEQVTTKIRPVYNCSFKLSKNTPSINEASYSGLDLMNSLLKLMFIFRTNDYVILSDIKHAFLSIRLKEEFDKNKFCFLWYRNDQLITFRYNTILFGYTASPFILHYIMKYHIEKFPDDKCKEILSSNFFVDNLIFTGNNIVELNKLYHQAYNCMYEGGFILRSWTTNCESLRKCMKDEKLLVEHESVYEKVLGYEYKLEDDTLHVSEVNYGNATTKRQVLSETSKLFDPLGFTLPLSIRGKLLMKAIWSENKEWDEELPGEMISEWEKLKPDLIQLRNIPFPRQALNESLSYGLNIFCDSSSSCYGFVAYSSSNVSNQFLFAKSKVTPVNPKRSYSIPTLELLGVNLALKCIVTILDSYPKFIFEYINISVDSQVVLNWILTGETKVKGRYVNNRLKDVSTMINNIKVKYNIKFCFHYVHTDINPADLLTRGVSYKKFMENIDLWLYGPTWLNKDLDNWPNYPLLSVVPEINNYFTNNSNNGNKFIDPNVLGNDIDGNDNEVMNLNTININFQPNYNEILNIRKYSDFDKVMNITKYLFLIFCNMKKVDPYKKALMYWVKSVQNSCYSKEIEFLKSDPKGKNIPLLVNNLNLFLDSDGILRSKGRISKCTYFNYDVHNPVILSRFHYFTTLLILRSHQKVQHLGVDSTLTHIRNQGFWIPKGRIAVKKVLNLCNLCKKINVRAFKYPKYTDIPKHHMKLVIPFKFVGIDFTGHLFIKNENTNTMEKMFILIFPCLNIRAIHLELIPDMSVPTFLFAFQRFCNHYTIPDYLYSDNARTFGKGANFLAKALESNEFQQELKSNNIKHVKIPLFSAWAGAFYERQIRTLKSCMYKVIGRAKLTYFEMLTTLSFIKNAINSRPLTYRSEFSDIEIITPNSFLRLNCNSSLILRGESENVWKETNQNKLEQTLDTQEELFNKFKQLWYQEYLLSLRESMTKIYELSWDNIIKVNDIVLIKSEIKPRPFWMTGRVLELVIGHDNKIRSVKVKQSNGQIGHHSINNLYPLEMSLSHEKTSPQDLTISKAVPINDKDRSELVVGGPSRPKRQAAEKCDKLIKSKLNLM